MMLGQTAGTSEVSGSGAKFMLFTKKFSQFLNGPLAAQCTNCPFQRGGGLIQTVRVRKQMTAFAEKKTFVRVFSGFKDPRTVRLLPLWYQIFDELKLSPKIILCIRNPSESAQSLSKRDGFDPVLGQLRWLMHMADFYRYVRSSDFCVVEYDKWFTEPEHNATKLRDFLGVQWPQSIMRNLL